MKAVSYTHLRAHETVLDLVCRLLLETVPLSSQEVYLRVTVEPEAKCTFSYSTDGKRFRELKTVFAAKPGRWIGAKVGLFAASRQPTNDKGYADFDWFRIEP